jgi:hypothetical protein
MLLEGLVGGTTGCLVRPPGCTVEMPQVTAATNKRFVFEELDVRAGAERGASPIRSVSKDPATKH